MPGAVQPETIRTHTDATDDDLTEELAQLQGDLASINDQLSDYGNDPEVQDDAWLSRAKHARRFKMRRVALITAVLKSRRLAQAAPQVAVALTLEKQKAEAHRQREADEARVRTANRQMNQEQFDAAEKRRAEQLPIRQRHQSDETRRVKGRAEMFVHAARAIWGKDDLQRVWNRAQQMFPDADEWASTPPLNGGRAA